MGIKKINNKTMKHAVKLTKDQNIIDSPIKQTKCEVNLKFGKTRATKTVDHLK